MKEIESKPSAISEHRSGQALPFYLTRNETLGDVSPEDDFLHPLVNATVADDSLTETQYLGFEIPEESIHLTGYLWIHPNLNVITGGVWAWQGIKRNTLSCELFDIRAWMHGRALKGDLHDYRLDNGYGVRVIEPLRKHRMTYEDVVRKNAVDVEFTAVNDAVMFGDGRHFEQAVRAQGEIRLRGKRYKVDSYNVRDRSWGRARPETSMPLPALGWKTGVYDDTFSFNCTAMDDHRLMPEWGGQFALPEDQLLKGGWVFRDGQFGVITRCIKRTQRASSTLFPTLIEMELTDNLQRHYKMKGIVLACSYWAVQPNLHWVAGSVHWECEGRSAFGEIQEAHWTDFIRAFLR